MRTRNDGLVLGDRPDELRTAERVGSALLGVAFGLLGARRGGVLGAALVGAGAYGVVRALTGTARPSLPPRVARPGPERVRQSVSIAARPEELYGFWRDLQNRPDSIRHVAAIPHRADIIEDVPGLRLGWRTRPESSLAAVVVGRVRFVGMPGGTRVEVVLQRAHPRGALASWLGRTPSEALRADLAHLKTLFERGDLSRREVAALTRGGGWTAPADRPNGHRRSNGHRPASAD